MLFMFISPPSEQEKQTTTDNRTKITNHDAGKPLKHNKSVPVSSVQAMPLEKGISEYIQKEKHLYGAVAGISIRDAVSGEVVYERLGDTRLHPASNMKLLTAAAALSQLGPEYRFSTEILTTGSIRNRTLHGDLFLKGKGDPTLLPEDFALLAKKIKKKGIAKIDGDIIGDDTWYDDVRLSPDLNWNDEQWYYGAQISALTASPDKDFDAGSVIVNIKPGEVGKKPTISLTPKTDYVQVENNAITVAADHEKNITLNRVHGSNVLTIDGTIPVTSDPVKEWMTVREPTGYALSLFQQALKKQGITWTGRVKTGITATNARTLFVQKSIPLSELFVPFMKLSNNTHAEILVKEMGKVVHGEGSWEKGLEVVKTELNNLGIDTEKLLIRDGSGISHVNLIPPNEITKLLYEMQNENWFDTYMDSLPVAGHTERMVGGTLRNRLNGYNVQAKTGTIFGVSTLAGFVETKNGEKRIFSIMLNNLLDEQDGPMIEDNLIKIIANQ